MLLHLSQSDKLYLCTVGSMIVKFKPLLAVNLGKILLAVSILMQVLTEGKMNSWDKILYAFLLWKKIDKASILSSVFHLYACLDLLDILT